MRSAVLLLAACGRVGFDEQVHDAGTDAAACIPQDTHDEDADGVADSCDVCPHIAGAHDDRDGDGVGDACDPQPELARQRIAVFDPLTSLAAWEPANTFAAIPDAVMLADAMGGGGRIARAFVPETDAITIGVQAMNAGAGQALFAVMFVESFSSGQIVYCEHFGDGTDWGLLVTYTLDGSNFVHPDGVDAPPIANAASRLTASITPTSIACNLARGGTQLDASAARPAEVVPQLLAIYAENVQLRLDYFLQIRTDP